MLRISVFSPLRHRRLSLCSERMPLNCEDTEKKCTLLLRNTHPQGSKLLQIKVVKYQSVGNHSYDHCHHHL